MVKILLVLLLLFSVTLSAVAADEYSPALRRALLLGFGLGHKYLADKFGADTLEQAERFLTLDILTMFGPISMAFLGGFFLLEIPQDEAIIWAEVFIFLGAIPVTIAHGVIRLREFYSVGRQIGLLKGQIRPIVESSHNGLAVGLTYQY